MAQPKSPFDTFNVVYLAMSSCLQTSVAAGASTTALQEVRSRCVKLQAIQQHQSCHACHSGQPIPPKQQPSNPTQQRQRQQQQSTRHQQQHQQSQQHQKGQLASQQQRSEQQRPQQPYWYDEQGPQQLRAALQLPSWRFQSLIHEEPSILAYQPDTLQLTLQALCTALHLNIKTVVGIIEQRPGLLLQPQEAVQVLQHLSQLVGRTTQQTAFLLSPHPQLLAMQPQQLQHHIQQLAGVMHLPHAGADLQAAAEAATARPASFLQLLAMPVAQTASRLQDLSTALDAPPSVTAQLVLQHPALLNMSPAVLRSRLFALAEAEGSSCRQLLAGLDEQQIQGLSGLLLLSPSRLMEQLQGVQALLASLQQQGMQQSPGRGLDSSSRPGGSTSSSTGISITSSTRSSSNLDSSATAPHSSADSSLNENSASSSRGSSSSPASVSSMAARLLLRLGTRTTLSDVQVRLVGLQGATRKVPHWQQQLAAAGDVELAELLSASHEGLAQAKYLSEAGGVADSVDLVQAVLMPAGQFSKRWPGYAVWLSGASSV
jgi:hypothetical protein